MQFGVRQADLHDADALARLRWDFSAEYNDVSPDQFAAYHAAFCEFWSAALAARTWCCWIAEREQEIIATIYVQIIGKVPRPTEVRRRYGYVASVYTPPEARSQEIGSQLMQRVIQWAAAEELEFLVLWHSEEGIESCHRLGLQPRGQ